MTARYNMVGTKFGRLTCVSFSGKSAKKHLLWKFRCDCGKTTVATGGDVRSGHTKSCGCLQVEKSRTSRLRHGHTKSNGTVSRTYAIWRSMKQRCLNPRTKEFKNYGARGISVCSRWMEFDNFLEDVGEIPKGLTIDRIDNNSGYNKENYRLSTQKTQCNNKRNNLTVFWDDIQMTGTELGEKIGVSHKLISIWVKKGKTDMHKNYETFCQYKKQENRFKKEIYENTEVV